MVRTCIENKAGNSRFKQLHLYAGCNTDTLDLCQQESIPQIFRLVSDFHRSLIGKECYLTSTMFQSARSALHRCCVCPLGVPSLFVGFGIIRQLDLYGPRHIQLGVLELPVFHPSGPIHRLLITLLTPVVLRQISDLESKRIRQRFTQVETRN